jgi:hypothetical protein
MPVVTVRPDGVSTGAASFTVTGAANAAAATNDNSDASFVRKTSAVSGTATLSLTFGTATISASERVKRVRLRARVETDNANGKMDLMLGTRVNGLTYYYTGYAVRGAVGVSAPVAVTGAWFNSSPDGASWDQSRIDALRGQYIEYKDSTDIGYVFELYIDVDKASQPTVTASAPTGTITSTATPEVQWTYTDPDAADPQAFYEVRVFTAAQYGAGGFDPATSTATWQSGIVESSEPGAFIGEGLLSDTYRAYVRVAKSINGDPFWSTWVFSQFTLTLSPPPPVAIAAAWSSSEGKATLTLTGGAPGMAYSSQYFQVQRSDDAGVTWALLRNGGEVAVSGSNTATVLDYEAPRGLTVRYRARSVGVAGEERIPSAWSAVIPQVLVTNDGTWWLKAVAAPALNVGSLKVTGPLTVTVTEPTTTFKPLGKNLPIVVSGLIGGEDGSYRIITNTTGEWSDVEAVLLHQGVLLVQDPTGRQRYIRVVSRTWNESYSAGRVVREVSVNFVEVEG